MRSSATAMRSRRSSASVEEKVCGVVSWLTETGGDVIRGVASDVGGLSTVESEVALILPAETGAAAFRLSACDTWIGAVKSATNRKKEKHRSEKRFRRQRHHRSPREVQPDLK